MISKQTLLNVVADYEALSSLAAAEVIRQVKQKPNACFCLAAGDTPKGMMRYLVEAQRRNEADFSQSHFVLLDEWVGLDKQDEGSCQHFLYTNLFEPLQIAESQIHGFDAKADDVEEECRQINTTIKELGGIDLTVLGIGVNGHIGFNEPGVDFTKEAHVVHLEETTTSVGAKYFADQQQAPEQGLTLGVSQIMEADKAVIIASGANKRPAVYALLYEQVSSQCPASILRTHHHFQLLCTEDSYPNYEAM
ncbi:MULTISPECIES: glucosamine-6-phosphate deaminase [Gracilibacillus]|uniref:glucosamine-6-phosphate deaminase n=1 Tax=Gracilibacillus TaxID=74385 RepID=UPI000AF0BD9C|nr:MULTISPECIES: glucosamine-6-phosphate deaminase [Gracilibacillus]